MANISDTEETRGTALQLPDSEDRPSIDFATLFGVIGAFATILLAMVMSGTLVSFVDVPAMLIVLGGTFLVTAISYSVSEILHTQSVVWRAVVYHFERPSVAAERVLRLSDAVRRRGALSLQNHTRSLEHNRFLHKAISMVVDGVPAEEIQSVLNSELASTAERHQRSAGILRRAGEVAPAMGLIGTLVGLVQMLGSLDDPSSIGPAMAVALLTTFYGAVLANMVFLPLANKLERNSHMETMINQIYAIAAVSMGRQENPRRLETQLNAALPPDQRVNLFD
ncbi:MAG: MotA/TolQ/ExbB proton channel family protein [Kiloniellales bacterium]|nr:MotA/TolQ/ExbB proton channel family protein [Kiloniellales bacterium]